MAVYVSVCGSEGSVKHLHHQQSPKRPVGVAAQAVVVQPQLLRPPHPSDGSPWNSGQANASSITTLQSLKDLFECNC